MFPETSVETRVGPFNGAVVAETLLFGPPATPVPATVFNRGGVTIACGPTPMPFNAKENVPALVFATRGWFWLPGYAGLNVTATVQTVPTALAAVPVELQPVTPVIVYSGWPLCDTGTVRLLMVSGPPVTWSKIFCDGGVVVPITVFGKTVFSMISRILLSYWST